MVNPSKSVSYDSTAKSAVPQTSDIELGPPPIEDSPPAYNPRVVENEPNGRYYFCCPDFTGPRVPCPSVSCPKITCPSVACPNFKFVYTQTTVILGISLLCILGIMFGLLFGIILKEVDDRGNFIDTECRSLGLNSTTYRCCDILYCSCSECGIGLYPPCDDSTLISQPANRSVCCGKSDCCRTCCDRCCTTTCTGSGDNRRCNNYCHDCNCKCCQEVAHRTCSFACGLCTDYEITYRVDATDRVKTQQEKCKRDDERCTTNMVQRYSRDKSWGCSYDKTNPDRVRFTGGVPGLNYAAIVFFSIFGFVFLVVLGFFVYYSVERVMS